MNMAGMVDRAWLAAHPLPPVVDGIDKNGRGRVLAAGGSLLCPGALMLTGQAALRAGAGKVQMATVEPVAVPLGVAMPEAAVIGLPMDGAGEISDRAAPLLADALGRCDTLVLGPGMADPAMAGRLVGRLLGGPRDDLAVVLDAAAAACAGTHRATLRAHGGRVLLTPHHGEMAALTGRSADSIAADPADAARDAAARFGAVVMLKGGETVIAAPDGTLLLYPGGGPGLATGGSGDVLAGIVAGLVARGAQPLVAAGWAAWLHGEAGRRLARDIGPTGFLAREILPLIPILMAAGAA